MISSCVLVTSLSEELLDDSINRQIEEFSMDKVCVDVKFSTTPYTDENGDRCIEYAALLIFKQVNKNESD